METKRLRRIVYEIFKTLNNSNPVFMKDIFHYSPNLTHQNHNLYIHTQNTTRLGNNSLMLWGHEQLFHEIATNFFCCNFMKIFIRVT